MSLFSILPRRGLILLVLASCCLLAPVAAAQRPVRAIAFSGEPFGVAKLEMPATVAGAFSPDRSIHVTHAEGRVHYPVSHAIEVTVRRGAPVEPVPPDGRAVGGGRLLSRLSNALRNATATEEQQTVGTEVWFLFRGDQPLEVRLSGGASQRVRVVPEEAGIEAHRDLMEDWWQAYCRGAGERIEAGDYPPITETYLVSMLSRRLGLAPIGDVLIPPGERSNQVASTLEMISGSERLQTAILKRAASGDTERMQSAELPLPNEPTWQPTDIPPLDDAIETEEIAGRVPPECMYLRFGSFENYLWFSDLSAEYGGDISRMVTLRGMNNDGNQRFERQLAVKMTELSRVMGASVIEDQAIIGRDMFFAHGASMGVLMKAKNPFLLRTSLNSDRSATANREANATLETETIAGKPVTFLSTPDNRLRSFFAIDGEWFFVTNSRTLVRRFFEVGEGKPSLADSKAFRLARQLMPLERADTVFAYFSPAMLRGLVSPKYQIELRRRLFSSADISLVHLARLAAEADGSEADTIDALIDEGYLPDGFGRRPDGSGPIVLNDRVIDSRRGERGTFLPIADVRIDGVTPEESDWYRRRADYYSEHWQQMDPIILGVQRSLVPAGPETGAEQYERLQIHAEIAPLVPEKYGTIAEQLGPPTRVAMQFAPDDIVAVQAHVVSNQLQGSIPPHHLFAGIKDAVPPDPRAIDGILKTYIALRMLPSYLGAWPQPGLLDRLPLGLGRGTPVGPGMSRLLGGLYRYSGDGFSVLSFQHDILVETLPFLAATEAEDRAQIRAYVGNLVDSRLEGWVNTQLYTRARETSLAGAELLNVLSVQLKLDDNAPAVAANILNAELQCPLGGHYIATEDDGAVNWVSTAWGSKTPPSLPPDDYLSPLLTWFRGLRANLTQYSDRLVVDATVDTERGALESQALTDADPPPRKVTE